MRFAWKAQYFGALPHALAVDDKHVYWTVRYHGNIGRAKLDGTRMNPRSQEGEKRRDQRQRLSH
jgi:hypothetical protein